MKTPIWIFDKKDEDIYRRLRKSYKIVGQIDLDISFQGLQLYRS